MTLKLDATGAVCMYIKADTTDLVNNMKAATEIFSSFSYKVSAELDEVKENIEKTEQTVSSFIKNAFAFELVKSAFRFMSDSVVEFGAELSTISAKTGFAVGELTRWSLAAHNAGASVEDLAKAANNINAENLGLLGISLEDAGRPLEELFPKVVSALQAIEDPAERARLATLAFGESAADLALINKQLFL